jgi:carbamoyltransferase
MSFILGVWDGHDAGAALIDTTDGGRIVCAANEERFSRRKLEVGFPERSIAACLAEARLSPAAVAEVAVPTFDVAKTLTRVFPGMKERYYLLRRRKLAPGPLASLSRSAKYVLTRWGPNPVSRAVSRWALGRDLARLGLADARLRLVPHHAAHAATAAYTSGFEEALVLTLDGIGDGLSGSVWALGDGRLRLLSQISGRDSLGIFFEHTTNLLNMRELEDEGKVMAMAGYAHLPSNGDNPLDDLFRVRGLNLECRYGSLRLRRHLAHHLAMMPSEQFAGLAQAVLEKKVTELVSGAIASTGLRRLAYAGGVASNIQVNRRLMESADLEAIFVFPHMGDGGIALGAAIWVALAQGVRQLELGDLRLGPTVEEAEMESALRESGLSFRKVMGLEREVASLLSEGNVVFWFQGRMEYGPRALGGRSILARPDRLAIRDRLNLRLKRRVLYQPFCPSILDEEAPALLEGWNGRVDRYMTMAYRTSPLGRERLAAVLGADGTSRPQMVGTEGGRYRRLLAEVRAAIGVGAVLNTSFNLHGEPLVASPKNALETFVRSGAEWMAMGDFLVEGRRE